MPTVRDKYDPGYVTEYSSGLEIHRKYDDKYDGWMESQLLPKDVPSLQVADDLLYLYREVNRLRRENWRLEQELKLWRR